MFCITTISHLISQFSVNLSAMLFLCGCVAVLMSILYMVLFLKFHCNIPAVLFVLYSHSFLHSYMVARIMPSSYFTIS